MLETIATHSTLNLYLPPPPLLHLVHSVKGHPLAPPSLRQLPFHLHDWDLHIRILAQKCKIAHLKRLLIGLLHFPSRFPNKLWAMEHNHHCKLRERIILTTELDAICLCKTFLCNNYYNYPSVYYIVEAHCHIVELEMGEFVSNSRGIESQ